MKLTLGRRRHDFVSHSDRRKAFFCDKDLVNRLNALGSRAECELEGHKLLIHIGALGRDETQEILMRFTLHQNVPGKYTEICCTDYIPAVSPKADDRILHSSVQYCRIADRT